MNDRLTNGVVTLVGAVSAFSLYRFESRLNNVGEILLSVLVIVCALIGLIGIGRLYDRIMIR